MRGIHPIPNLGWPQALDLLARRVVDDSDVFISHVYPFAQVPEAMRFAAQARSEVVKVMVDFALAVCRRGFMPSPIARSTRDPGPNLGSFCTFRPEFGLFAPLIDAKKPCLECSIFHSDRLLGG